MSKLTIKGSVMFDCYNNAKNDAHKMATLPEDWILLRNLDSLFRKNSFISWKFKDSLGLDFKMLNWERDWNELLYIPLGKTSKLTNKAVLKCVDKVSYEKVHAYTSPFPYMT